MQCLKNNQTHAEITDELFCWLTPAGCFTALKPALLQTTGWHEQDWIGKNICSFLHLEDAPVFEKVLAQVLMGKSAAIPGARCLTKSGNPLRRDLLFVPIVAGESVTSILCFGQSADRDSSPAGVFAPRNVVPLRDSRESDVGALSTKELSGLTDLLETLLANSPIGVALLDRDLRFICINQALVSLHGFAPEQHLGRTVWDLAPQLAAATAPSLKLVLETGVPIADVEVTIGTGRHPDFARCCLISYYPIRSPKGEIVSVAEMVLDITDRKRAERALRDSEDQLRLAIESANLGTWDLNPVTGKLRWSERMKQMVGLLPNAQVGQDVFLSSLHSDDKARVEKAIEEAKDPNGSGEYRIEYRTIGISDNVERWHSVRGKVYFDEKKTPVRFTGIALDVTERKRAEEALEKITRELSRSNEALENFAHVVSHDLKEPLRMISSFVKLLSQRYRGKLDTDADSFMAYAVNGAERMRVLIDDVLLFAKAGSADRTLQQVNSGDILESALNMLRLSVEETKTLITHDPLPEVLAEPRGLQQVFQNLIQNAIRFRKKAESSRIHVRASPKEGEWLFSVKDNGIGIDQSKLSDIFIPLRRLHSVSDYPGSGLGLAICEKIIKSHGGAIWVESEPNRGAIFYFTLPKAHRHG